MKEFFKQYLKELSEFLKGYEFKKSGNSFYRKSGKNYGLINVQKSKSSEELKFTINVGVFSQVLADFFEEEIGKKPSVEDLHWSKRIGHFLPDKPDLWFKFGNETEFEKVVYESKSIIEKVVLPEMESLLEDEGLECLWTENEASYVTEFQRLLNLSVFLSRKKSPAVNEVIEDLKKYAKEKRLSIEYHLDKLNAEYATTI